MGQITPLVQRLLSFMALTIKNNILLVFSNIYLVPTVTEALENRTMKKISIVPILGVIHKECWKVREMNN